MGLEWSLSDLNAFFQVLFLASGFGVSIVTLIVLIRYAKDTKTLAEVSLRQEEESVIPYLSITPRDKVVSTIEIVQLNVRNTGKGPAIGIRVEGEERSRNWLNTTPTSKDGKEWTPSVSDVGDLGVGDTRVLSGWVLVSINHGKAIKLTYRSLTGRRYQTTYAGGKHGPVTQTFRRLGDSERER